MWESARELGGTITSIPAQRQRVAQKFNLLTDN
jgi:hypothetical protein